MKNDLAEKLILLVIGIVIVSAIGGYLSISPEVIDSITNLMIGLFIGAITSFLAVHGIKKEEGWDSITPKRPMVIFKLKKITEEIGLKSP